MEEKEKRIFKFDRSPDEAHYFNLKLYELKKLERDLDEKIDDGSKVINRRIKPIFEEVNERENALNNKLKILEIPIELQFSHKIVDTLKGTHIVEDIETPKETGTTLRDIEMSSKEIIKNIKRKIDNVINLVEDINDLVSIERDFMQCIDECITIKEKVKEIFDTEEFKPKIEQFETEINRIRNEYSDFAKTISSKSRINDIKRAIGDFEKNCNSWKKNLLTIKDDALNKWISYKTKTVKFTKRVKDMLNLLSKSHKINISNVNEKIELLHQRIEPEKIEELKDKISSLEKLKEDIRKSAMNIAENFITPSEAKVLDILYSKKDDKLNWISYEDLLKEIEEKYEMTVEEAEKALKNLVSKGYVLRGFSLSI